MLSTGQAAELLGVDPWTVRDMITSGELPAYRFRKHYRISRAELDAWIEEHRA